MLSTVRSRLLAAYLGPTLLLFGIAGVGGYLVTRQILEDELGRSLSAQAAAAASQLSADRVLGLEAGDDAAQTRTYRNLHRTLDELRAATSARRIFAVDQSFHMKVDSGGSLPVGTEVPELARDRRELARVMAGSLASSSLLFEGVDGRLYKTGYAPLRKADGTVVGAVGVEGSAAFFAPLRRLSRGFVLSLGAGLLGVMLVVFLVARSLTRPLERLLESALRIGRGDLVTSVPAQPTREIGGLARELEAMRSALQSRDQQLKMMIAGVAHEVRNPLGGIELFSGLLREELPQEGASRDHVERIVREVDYLRRTVEQFLAFAREEQLQKQSVAAVDLGQKAVELTQADAGERGVKLVTSVAPAELLLDEHLVLPALVNLLKNAVQASPQEGTVTLAGTARASDYLFTVSDQGSGIDAATRERIFEPFFTTREKGTGLGLPLARKIAQAHGGELKLRPGVPTTFELVLPRTT